MIETNTPIQTDKTDSFVSISSTAVDDESTDYISTVTAFIDSTFYSIVEEETTSIKPTSTDSTTNIHKTFTIV